METIRECVDFLNENFKFRVDQGLHDLSKLLPHIDEDDLMEFPKRKNSSCNIEEEKSNSLFDMLLESHKETPTKQKIQIAPNLSLFGSADEDSKKTFGAESEKEYKAENLEESMMEFSHQIEDMMAVKNTVIANALPMRLKSLSERIESHVGGSNSLQPLNLQLMEDAIIKDLNLLTPFAIQTKTSKK